MCLEFNFSHYIGPKIGALSTIIKKMVSDLEKLLREKSTTLNLSKNETINIFVMENYFLARFRRCRIRISNDIIFHRFEGGGL